MLVLEIATTEPNVTGNYLWWGITVVPAVPAAIAAFPLERRRKARRPDTLPYTWGLYVGLSVLLIGAAFMVIGVGAIAVEPNSDPAGSLAVGIVGLLYLFSGYFTIKRSRIAFIAATILTLNIIWWIANAVYLRNRWREMGRTGRSAPDAMASGDTRIPDAHP